MGQAFVIALVAFKIVVVKCHSLRSPTGDELAKLKAKGYGIQPAHCMHMGEALSQHTAHEA